MADFIPTVKARRGKGPRTKKQMRRKQAREALMARLEFLPPMEEKPRREDRDD